MATQVVEYPWGSADIQTPAFASTIAVSISNQLTIINPATLTGAVTINLTLDQGVKAGARILYIALSDGTARATTFGTGFQMAAGMAGVISKTKAIEFIYNGTAFYATSAGVQVD